MGELEMEFGYILLAISTVAIFSHGYFCRKKNFTGVLISTGMANVPMLVDITTMGVSEYGQHIANVSAQGLTTAVIYVIFFWGFGYVLGGINLKKKDIQDDLPGNFEDVEYSRLNPYDN